MSARNDTRALMQQLGARGISLSFDEVNTLRRAQITLHRWAELECGDGNDYASWSIESAEATDIPFLCSYEQDREIHRTRIFDREKGDIRRVSHICAHHKLDF